MKLNETDSFQEFVVIDEEVLICGGWEDSEILSEAKASDAVSEEVDEKLKRSIWRKKSLIKKHNQQ